MPQRIRTRLTDYAGVRYVSVSLPLVPQLPDGVRYMKPADVKPPEGDTERRRQRGPRAPSFRYLVRLAMRCQSAEELGERLKAATTASGSARAWHHLAEPAPRPVQD